MKIGKYEPREVSEEKQTKCRACNGTGKQIFHGLFDSYHATCNFCAGHGTYKEELKWYDLEFKGRGLA